MSSNNDNYKKFSKRELYNKLHKLSLSELKKMDISREEVDFLKSTLLNHKLGLVVNDNGNVVLNYEEQNEEQILNDNYFGLEEIKELHINSKDKNNHLLIEGDNYYALKALQVSGIKVDVIYIDPPYNTGNKDFVYNDDFVEKDDQFKHSKWLSFMKKRLILARELLADDGIIFVSIDDNEQAYLKVLMDEIFGEENFICNFVRRTVSHVRKLANNEVQVLNDFIVTYSRNKYDVKLLKKLKGTRKFPFSDEKGNYELKNFQNSGADGKRSLRPNLYYPIFYNESTHTFYLKKTFANDIEILPKKVKNEDGRWLWKKETFLNNIDKFIYKNNILYYKKYEYDYENLVLEENYKNWLDEFPNSEGSLLISKLGINFSYPKSIELISFLISFCSSKVATILDFFAGSGTTAQAVMELNEKDGGNRRFILCTNNENNIAQDTCRERIYRVINGQGTKKEQISWEYSKDKKSLKNNSMKYLKVKPIHNVNSEYEEINDMKEIYKNEFDKDLSIKDFR